MARPLSGRPGELTPSGEGGQRLRRQWKRRKVAVGSSGKRRGSASLHPALKSCAPAPRGRWESKPRPGSPCLRQSSRELNQLALSGRGNWVPVFRAPPTKLLANHMQRASPGPAYSKPDRTQGRAAMNPAWDSPTPTCSLSSGTRGRGGKRRAKGKVR
ncbi:unnamed protein product [Rangifer tarandus platyrhynchus]|uniref:Uncharacterized protein n=2 Tax=Rangifer tarandus platyrhynchus TaxID=3082113 RepID=A0AC59Z9P9_RANTA|nr:unnamed protein product [Rangifer tarandus platyrhynchus]